MLEIAQLDTNQAAVCEPILAALPDWFGIEASVVQYLEELPRLETYVARVAGEAVGFIAIERHNPFTAEIHVMGVLPGHHRRGCGRRLVEVAEARLRVERFEFLAVKTLAPSHPDPGYAKTRAFYAGLGFRPVQEFPLLWGPENPCLLMIKSLLAARELAE